MDTTNNNREKDSRSVQKIVIQASSSSNVNQNLKQTQNLFNVSNKSNIKTSKKTTKINSINSSNNEKGLKKEVMYKKRSTAIKLPKIN